MIFYTRTKPVSSVTDRQFVVSADLIFYTKLVPNIGSIVELRTNARQHSTERHMTISIYHLNQDEYHVVFNNKSLYRQSNTNMFIQKSSY